MFYFLTENFILFSKKFTVHLSTIKKITNKIVWNCLSFPVFCVIFPDFSSLFKIPDFSLTGKYLPIFPRFRIFPVRVGTLIKVFQPHKVQLYCFYKFWISKKCQKWRRRFSSAYMATVRSIDIWWIFFKNDDVKHNFPTLLAHCYVVTSFCNIWWHHFATFDDIILQHLMTSFWMDLNDLHILLWILKSWKDK